MRRTFVVFASFALLPAMAEAQRGGMGAGASMARPAPFAAAPAPRFAARAGAPMPMAVRVPTTAAHPTSGVNVVPGGHWVRTRSGAIVLRPGPRNTRRMPNVSVNRGVVAQDLGVPGLGFDFAHFAATHPNGDRDHRRDRGFVGAFIPFFGGGGYYMPLFPDDMEEAPPAEAAPPVEVAEGPEPRAPYPYPYGYAPRPQEPAPAAVPAAPERPADQFVFVRRDGTVFFAVAYAWDNGTLRYVTSEGLGRSLAGSQLDLSATQQFNEQRGLSFHAPAA